MNCRKISYKLHAVEQMFKRSITQAEVEAVIEQGTTIANYPDDKPYPSMLRLAFVDDPLFTLLLLRMKQVSVLW